MQYLTTPLLAFGVTLLGMTIVLRIFPRVGLLDFPERYSLRRTPLPYPAGIVAVLVFLSFFAAIEGFHMQSLGVVGGVIILGIMSFIDDRHRLSAKLRLCIQVLVALLIFATGTRIYTLTNPLEGLFGDAFLKLDTIDLPTSLFGPLPILSGIFTIVWIMLTVNALNWLDGIPGQVNLLSAIGFLTIGLLCFSDRVDQPQLGMIALILCAIACASLLFDLPPPKVVMGDTGAMFFGLLLGTITIYAGGKVATAFLVLGVPLIDSGLVVIRRLLHGKSPMRGSASGEHLHHRLLAIGWSPWRVILTTACIGGTFGAAALFLGTLQKFLAALLLFGLLILLSLYADRKNRL